MTIIVLPFKKTPVKLYNSLNRCIEDFQPLDNKHVTMYVCGPTVYDRIHLGNARPLVTFDILYRLLRQHYPAVTYVRNITDIDDKINKRALERALRIQDLTRETIDMFHEDTRLLGLLPPVVEPRATDHIEPIIEMIETLVAKGHAYVVDGHVMFAVDTFETYGALSSHDLEYMIAGARVEVASYKKNPCDFVLWKPSDAKLPGWQSPWGRGRPGWHIECSAMSSKYLGQSFDIHGGGRDLIFPHHENEIAQSKGCYGHTAFARYWLHNEMLTINGEKMSKSLGNFITLNQVLKDYDGEVVRFFLLSTHYRKLLDWTQHGLAQAKKILDKFYGALEGYDDSPAQLDPRILEALDADLNTPLAISGLHDIVSEIYKEQDPARKTVLQGTLRASGTFLGLFSQLPQKWFQSSPPGLLSSQDIETLILERTEAKAAKDFASADRIRAQLQAEGILLLDSATGTTWRRSSI